jgi:hypothetical protein
MTGANTCNSAGTVQGVLPKPRIGKNEQGQVGFNR